MLLAGGLFRENGVFYAMPKIDIHPLAKLFRANILKILKKEGRIDDGLIEKIMKWRHNSGFSVHNGVRLSRGDEAGRESLAQYIMRNSFSVKKITYNLATGRVIYKSKKNQGRIKGGRKNFQVFTATKFIGAITQHIRERPFNWFVITAGIQTVAGVSGKRENRLLQVFLNFRPGWKLLTYPITGRKKHLLLSGGNA